ncbi:MAG: 50S ribosomal protein L13 [Candidatus Bathyarchaeales archaeon]
METQTKQPVIVDASGLILGRLGSDVAKRLLKGENVVIVNAEKAVISGKRLNKLKAAREFLEVGHYKQGPFHRRRPDQIVRRVIRGMLPWSKAKGKQAYRRLKVFIGVPEEIKNKSFEVIQHANAQKLKCPYFTVGEFAKEIGWNVSGE